MASREIKSLDQLMDGALTERFNKAMADVWNNVFDKNTDPKRVRSVTLTVKVKANDLRNAADMVTDVKVNVAPPIPLSQLVLIEQHDDGSVTATEHTNQVSGQLDIDGHENIPNVVEFNTGKKEKA